MTDDRLTDEQVARWIGDHSLHPDIRAALHDWQQRRARDAGDAAARALAERVASWTSYDIREAGGLALHDCVRAYRAALAAEQNKADPMDTDPIVPAGSSAPPSTTGAAVSAERRAARASFFAKDACGDPISVVGEQTCADLIRAAEAAAEQRGREAERDAYNAALAEAWRRKDALAIECSNRDRLIADLRAQLAARAPGGVASTDEREALEDIIDEVTGSQVAASGRGRDVVTALEAWLRANGLLAPAPEQPA